MVRADLTEKVTFEPRLEAEEISSGKVLKYNCTWLVQGTTSRFFVAGTEYGKKVV